MVMKIMDGKFKLKGHLKTSDKMAPVSDRSSDYPEHSGLCDRYKSRSGCYTGTLIYLACAVGIFCYHRPQMFNDLVAFASQYEFLEKRVLEELALPYAIMDMQGENDLVQQGICAATGKDQVLQKKY